MAKNSGSELRDTVAGLLSIKFSNVETEHRLTATTADVVYIDDNSTFNLTIAIECKDWSKPLTSADIANIYSLYQPSLDNGEIDRLLLISRHELGMQPSETLRRLSHVAHFQFDAFVHNLMNFNLLLQSNVAAFRNHESCNNFIQPRVRGKNTHLFDIVMDWLKAENNPVSMVYGGYGLGKTSFSHYLTSELSKRYRENRFDRIPIRIPLGGLFTKQDLKALVCSELTGAEGQPPVVGFTYDLFLQMVKSGAIFLVLDGFDEMRHAMSIEDFAYTFEQMSPLFKGNSKAIILGRPDAFFSNQEETDVINSLLSSTDSCSDEILKIEVDKFTREEVDTYLSNFMSQKPTTEQERSLVSNLKESEYEILSRPVQANMFTKILSMLAKTKKEELTRYELYSGFIRQFAVREDSKPARTLPKEGQSKEFGYNDPRSVFMQNIAWWISTVHRENRFLPEDIPPNLLPREFKKAGNDATSVREALVGSITEHASNAPRTHLVEKKGANYYYFPHKSYIEFLVSQYFCRQDFTKEMYRTFFTFANPEMLSFVKEGPNLGAQNIATGLEHVIGKIPREIIQIGAQSDLLSERLEEKRYGDLSTPSQYMAYEYLLKHQRVTEVESLLLNMVNTARTNKSVTAALLLNGDYLTIRPSKNHMMRLVSSAFTALEEVQFADLQYYKLDNFKFDASQIHKIVLSRCLIKINEAQWRFRARRLIEAGQETAKRGFWSTEYGAPGSKETGNELVFEVDEMRELLPQKMSTKKRDLVNSFLG